MIALSIALMPCFSIADSKDVTKEYKFTSDTDVISELSYDAPEKVKEEGKTYKLKDIKYKVIEESKPLTEKKKITTKDKDRFDKRITKTVEGKNVILEAEEDIEWKKVKTEKKTKTQEYKEGDTIPQSITDKKVDSNGNTVDITLNLKSTEKKTRTENFSAPAKFYSYTKNTRVYDFYGKEVTVASGSPTWDGYKSDVAKSLGLNGNEYMITGGSWTSLKKIGEKYVRTATYTGIRTMNIVDATYEESDESALYEYVAEIEYVQSDYEPEYTVKAIATYKAGLSTGAAIAIGTGIAIVLFAAVMMLYVTAKRKKQGQQE